MNKLKVAVINSSKEITQMLSEILTDEGFETCSTYTHNFKNQEDLMDKYINENNPDVILYDIAPPYVDNYLLFKRLSKRETTKHIPFVLTSTNKGALESLVGDTATHELIGKPYDLRQIIKAVNNAYKKQHSSKSSKDKNITEHL